MHEYLQKDFACVSGRSRIGGKLHHAFASLRCLPDDIDVGSDKSEQNHAATDDFCDARPSQQGVCREPTDLLRYRDETSDTEERETGRRHCEFEPGQGASQPKEAERDIRQLSYVL
ncbi:hypothetical protein [Steroidobacter cummioxidans]|uniref:hypothetical protein n=1 Tax=Steroidobacter cummioxidans TaxID=1803913 RepID=UPI001379DA1F|nr:hypothetical protein [Steroidobacter cummioxidans]